MAVKPLKARRVSQADLQGGTLDEPLFPAHLPGQLIVRFKRGADRHYDLMPTRDICDLPVWAWAAPDAHLYLWVTNNFLRDGLQVMDVWGFRYITTITWMKDRAGLETFSEGDEPERCVIVAPLLSD